jgi:hypothetical protein
MPAGVRLRACDTIPEPGARHLSVLILHPFWTIGGVSPFHLARSCYLLISATFGHEEADFVAFEFGERRNTNDRFSATSEKSRELNQAKEEIMAERRSLMEGLKQISPKVDPVVAESIIVHGTPGSAARPKDRKAFQPTPTREPQKTTAAGVGPSGPISRAPLTTRSRSDFATALRRASLEHQLQGISLNSQQAILEQALEP